METIVKEEKKVGFWLRNSDRILYWSTWILYFIGVAWIFVGFPLVSVSTNELKSRGLFIDEKAIITSVQTVSQYLYLTNLVNHNDVQPAESTIDNLNSFFCGNHDYSVYCQRHSKTVLELEIPPSFAPESLESNIFTFVLPHASCHQYRKDFLQYFANIIQAISESKWFHRRLYFLFVESSEIETDYQKVIDELFFPKNFSSSSSSSFSVSHSYHYHGNIRESYIIDFSHFFSSFCEHYSSPSSTPQTSLQFQELLLHYQGKNGLLPNLDLLSTSRQLFPLLVSLEYSYEQLLSPSSSNNNKQKLFLQDCLEKVNGLLKSLQLNKGKFFDEYEKKLCSLLSHGFYSLSSSLLSSSSSSSVNLHSLWLEKNIDSFTLIPTLPDTTSLSNDRVVLSSSQKKKKSAKLSSSTANSLEDLFSVVLGYVYMSNHLYGKEVYLFLFEGLNLIFVSFLSFLLEELHHSYFYYLILGNKNFLVSVCFLFVLFF
jgi:hypothetical protein